MYFYYPKTLSFAAGLFACIYFSGLGVNGQIRPMPTLPERVDTVEVKLDIIEAGKIVI